MRTDDGYIINKCINGEPEAFGLLIEKYKVGIYAFILAKIHNFHDAQDVAQDVFIRAYQNLGSLKDWDCFAGWLYRIASNLCKNKLKSESKRHDREVLEDYDESTLNEASIKSYHDDALYESIHESLDSLPETYQQVLTMYYMSGMNSLEIAKVLCISPANVRYRLSKAREQLREEILMMMRANFEQNKLPASFTIRVVELVKRIKINPISQPKNLPWGLSLTTGIIVIIFCINPYMTWFSQINPSMGSPMPAEIKTPKVGEIPIDILKTSQITVISKDMGKGNGDNSKQPDIYNTFFIAQQGRTWTKKTDMPTARSCHTTELNGKIYAIGGTPDHVIDIPTVEEYNPKTDTWSKKPDMSTARKFLDVASVNGKIYAIGGFTQAGNPPLSIVEEYNPKSDIWSRKANMPTGRSGLSASVINDRIYVIGGWGGQGNVSTVEEYDPVQDKWARKSDMLTKRNGLSTSVVNGKIYAIGGFMDGGVTTAVEEYDVSKDTWQKRSDMPTARGALSTSVVNGKIYAFGGIPDLNNVYSTVEIYDPTTDMWTKDDDMPTARGYFSTCVVDGKIYVIGGVTWGPAILSTVEEYDTGYNFKNVQSEGKEKVKWGQMKYDR